MRRPRGHARGCRAAAHCINNPHWFLPRQCRCGFDKRRADAHSATPAPRMRNPRECRMIRISATRRRRRKSADGRMLPENHAISPAKAVLCALCENFASRRALRGFSRNRQKRLAPPRAICYVAPVCRAIAPADPSLNIIGGFCRHPLGGAPGEREQGFVRGGPHSGRRARSQAAETVAGGAAGYPAARSECTPLCNNAR